MPPSYLLKPPLANTSPCLPPPSSASWTVDRFNYQKQLANKRPIADISCRKKKRGGGLQIQRCSFIFSPRCTNRLRVNTALSSYLNVLVKLHLLTPQCVDNLHVVCTVGDGSRGLRHREWYLSAENQTTTEPGSQLTCQGLAEMEPRTAGRDEIRPKFLKSRLLKETARDSSCCPQSRPPPTSLPPPFASDESISETQIPHLICCQHFLTDVP